MGGDKEARRLDDARSMGRPGPNKRARTTLCAIATLASLGCAQLIGADFDDATRADTADAARGGKAGAGGEAVGSGAGGDGGQQ